MVGNKYVRSVFLDIRVTLHFYRQQKRVTDDIGPNLTWPITPEMSIADATSDNDSSTYEDGGYQKNRQTNENLVDEVENL